VVQGEKERRGKGKRRSEGRGEKKKDSLKTPSSGSLVSFERKEKVGGGSFTPVGQKRKRSNCNANQVFKEKTINRLLYRKEEKKGGRGSTKSPVLSASRKPPGGGEVDRASKRSDPHGVKEKGRGKTQG